MVSTASTKTKPTNKPGRGIGCESQRVILPKTAVVPFRLENYDSLTAATMLIQVYMIDSIVPPDCQSEILIC